MSTTNLDSNIAASVQHDNGDSHGEILDLHVVVLINYLRKHHVLALKEFAKSVRKLTILLSVPMEPDRDWEAEWEGLDVRVQKNLMWTANWKHSSGFSESNFIHFPVDTPFRLKELKPDLILSYEMGVRTMLSVLYRQFRRSVPLVMVGNMSEHIEVERGFLRRLWRKFLCLGIEYYTYNGPSCRRYLSSLGIPDDRMFHFPYCIDGATVAKDNGKLQNEPSSQRPIQNVKLLYCGAISQRKGIVQFSNALSQWCENNPHQHVELLVVGKGGLQQEVELNVRKNLKIDFWGSCNAEQIKDAYRIADICVFPTLADEWGLVPIEAMASGVPVLGSIFAQSVESHCTEGINGWIFDPTNHDDLLATIDRALTSSESTIRRMGIAARNSVSSISPTTSAKSILEAVSTIVAKRQPAKVKSSATPEQPAVQKKTI